MNASEREPFGKMLAAVYEFYGKEITVDALSIWWSALLGYELAAVREALHKHVVNPDNGKFLPKPADVVRMLGGSSLDSALVAVTKFERALSGLGGGYTVVFDDPLIHRVVEEMGGWIELTQIKSRDWEFRRTEFMNRYRAYKSRSEVPPYPAKLVGRWDAENGDRWINHPGYKPDENLRFIGDAEAARRVMIGGGAGSAGRIAVTMPKLKAPAMLEGPK